MNEARPDQEGFGEASLGEAQSDDPPADPEMLEDEAVDEGAESAEQPADAGAESDDDPAEAGTESYGGDQDAGPASGDEA